MFDDEKEEGFSLVELLVVIVIVGILSAFAVAAFMNQRKKANDAALQSDLKTTATQIMTWTIDNKLTDFPSEGGGRLAVIEGENAQNLLDRHVRWNDIPGAPQVHLSEGNTIEVTLNSRSEEAPSWDRIFTEGEFCLAGSSPNSTYDYTPGSAQRHLYNHYLYYDVQAGGVKTMEELKEMQDNGSEISCYAYVNQWSG